MSGVRHWEQDKEATLYVGNIDERLSDALIWELMMQMGPVVNVHLPKDRVTQQHQGYGFVEFASPQDADYAESVMNGVRVWEKPLRVNKASADRRGGPDGAAGGGQSVGAELFVGNLDSLVDEKVLFDTFSRFGPFIAAPKVAKDEANLSKGYGFISYASFQASDDAIANMHGQYLMNKEITAQYAYKKDGKGERHGDAAERALAEQAKQHGVQVNLPAMPAALTGAPTAPAAMQGGPVQRPGPPIGAPAGYANYGAGAYQGYPAYPAYGGYQQGYGGNYPGFPSQANYTGYQAQYPSVGGAHPGYQTQGNFGGFPPNQNNFAGYGAPQQPPAPPPAPRQYAQSPLQAPASGLPARPPPSAAGYGGRMAAPGMQQAPHQGLPPPPGMIPPRGTSG